MAKFTAEFQEEVFSFLYSQSGFDKYGLLVPKDIFTLEYLDIGWNVIIKFYNKYKQLPTINEICEIINQENIPSKMKGVICNKLKDVITINTNAGFIEAELTKYIKKIYLTKEILSYYEGLEKEDDDPDVYGFIHRITEINNFNLPVKEDFLDNFNKRIDLYKTGVSMTPIDIGLGEIAVCRGELGVVLAPPKRGKSLFLVSAGYGAVISGYKVLHITLELRKHSVELRYDRAILGISKNKLVSLEVTERVKEIFRDIKKGGGGVDIYEFPAGSIGIDTIYGLINKETKDNRPYDVIIIDYADLLISPRRYSERRFETSEIYKSLRALAVEFDVAVWTASQTNRGSFEQNLITMGDVAEDIGKMAICDLGVTLCQTYEERQSSPELGRLYIAGGREVLDGKVFPCIIDRDISRVIVRK